MSNCWVEACPVGWLLEALAGHPLGNLLFPRRSLRWVYCLSGWRTVTPADNFVPFNSLLVPCVHPGRTQQPGQTYAKVCLAPATVWRRISTTESRPATPAGRVPPDRVQFTEQECLFWAGQCPECSVIYWTVSPWVTKPGDECAEWHAEQMEAES